MPERKHNERPRRIPFPFPAALSALVGDDEENAMTPGGIEAQEAQGQATLCREMKLPIDMPREHRDALAAAGVEFADPVDALFVAAVLPEGWEKKATDHSMWSDLVDADGEVVARIFYKAAFYDQSANLSCTREWLDSHA